MTSYLPKMNEIQKRWYVVDLNGKVLGRAATRVADILRGKHKPQYTPHLDTGDFVVAINAKKIKLTGNKRTQKEYYNHSGYIGGLKTVVAERLLETHPERVFKEAVKGMIPKNILGRNCLSKLKIYADGNHPHSAQKPEEIIL